MKVAIIHDWLTGMRGGEAVLEAIVELFEQPEIFTLVSFPEELSPPLRRLKVHTSFLQKIPGMKRFYRHALPLMPFAIQGLDLSGFDLIVSSSHCVAKGVRKQPGAVHLSYVHAPMRYMWDRFEEYFGEGVSSRWVRVLALIFRPFLRSWDRKTSQVNQVNHFVANSQFIADRIREFYGRDSEVIYPFAQLDRFLGDRKDWDERFQGPQPDLMVGAFAPYKRTDLAIEVYNRSGRPLWIVGAGQDEKRLKAMAKPNVQFLGSLPNEKLTALYSQCRAFIFPGKEDFGITPLEAMASGLPVIAFGEGGASETVTHTTGVFFQQQTVEALESAIQTFEHRRSQIKEADCRARASEFTREKFKSRLRSSIEKTWKSAGKDPQKLERIWKKSWAV